MACAPSANRSGTADLASAIDDLLPQTQCRQCGHDGCRPYAEAITAGEAIDRCPPGGDELIARLAALTGRPMVPLEGSRGAPGPLRRARIDATECIGCVLCIDACPVDAIAGAPRKLHAVISAWCTGCALCVAPCPVDCIDMIPAGRRWSAVDAGIARARFAAREERRARRSHAAAPPSVAPEPPAFSAAFRRRAIDAALARARARRDGR